MFRKLFALFQVFAVAAFAASVSQFAPSNALIDEDSMRVDGTASKWSKVFWTDNMGWKTLLIEAKDDSTAGFANDSCAAKIELYQAFNVTNEYGSAGKVSGYNKYISVLKSHADPDSTSRLPLSYTLFDSLAIQSMDTASVYKRNMVVDTALTGNTSGWHYGDSLKTLQTSGFGAMHYIAISPDWGPGIALKVTGKNNNSTAGAGTLWRFRLVQAIGVPSKGK